MCVLSDPDLIADTLKKYPLGDVWGIGRRYAEFLNRHQIRTAFDLVRANRDWVLKKMTVVGLKLTEELEGLPRLEIDAFPENKKTICTARSFGTMLTDSAPVREAVSNFAARCAEKLRKQKTCANVILVFLHTNPFRTDLPQYARHIVIRLPVATHSGMKLVRYAQKGLEAIFREGFHYKKAGVIVTDLVPENGVQASLFDEVPGGRHGKIMTAMDELNGRYGRDKVRVGSQGFGRKWKLKQEKLSPAYTTRLSDIITIKV